MAKRLNTKQLLVGLLYEIFVLHNNPMNSRYEFFIKNNICLLHGMENIISYRYFFGNSSEERTVLVRLKFCKQNAYRTSSFYGIVCVS